MDYKYVYGPVASRRLGKSLGIAPITNNLCNFGCIYCQLGQTSYIPNEPLEHFETDEILNEITDVLKQNVTFDTISLVGDGEPILHSSLKTIITHIKKLTDKPIALITNGSLLYMDSIIDAIQEVDILLPSLDAYDASSFKRINRPFGGLSFSKIIEGLRKVSTTYKGQIWLEIMFLKDVNDHEMAIEHFKDILKTIRYDRLYLNTPVRPTREENVYKIDAEKIKYVQSKLGGIPIHFLSEEPYMAVGEDIIAALIALIRRHPLHYHEITGYLKDRHVENIDEVMQRLESNTEITTKIYQGFLMFLYKKG